MTKKRKTSGTGRPRKAATPPVSPPKKPIDAPPKAPFWLSKPAKLEWKRAAAQLVERGVLTSGDLATLEAFCSAKGRLVQAEALLQRDGLTVSATNGLLAKHPAVAIINEASSIIKTLGAALGLSPASRRRAATESTPKDASRWEGLVDG